MKIAGSDDAPIRPRQDPGSEATRGDQKQLAAWALSLTEEQRTEPILSVQDVLVMLKQAKDCVQQGVADTIPMGVPVHMGPLFIKALGSVGQGACDFLGYGLLEACRMRVEEHDARVCTFCAGKNLAQCPRCGPNAQ